MGLREMILEKVSKNEIDEALRNPNVMVGAEFEFKIPGFIDKYEREVDMFEKINDMEEEYAQYEDDLDVWYEENEKGDNNKMPFPTVPQWALDAGYDETDDIPPPSEIYPELRIDQSQLFRFLIKDFLNLETIPFKNMIISADHNAKSSKKWVIKPDGSLGIDGVEVVSPVLPLKEFLDICPKMFTWLNNGGDRFLIDESCGFHISISLKNVENLGKTLDITKLSVFMDEGYIYNFFATREFNTFARSAYDSISKNLIGLNAPKLAEKFIDEPDLQMKYPADHYMAINVEHLNTDNEYIEFRYVGGTDYHRKWDRIKSILAHYIFDLSLACDPDYKKKEYEHRLSRLLNKIQLFTVCVEMTKMFHDDTLDMKDPQTRKEWTTLWDTWKSLYIYKEGIDKDIHSEHGKKGFLRVCAMLDIKPGDIIWDWRDNRYMNRSAEGFIKIKKGV